MQTDPETGGAQPRENGHVAVDHNAPLTVRWQTLFHDCRGCLGTELEYLEPEP